MAASVDSGARQLDGFQRNESNAFSWPSVHECRPQPQILELDRELGHAGLWLDHEARRWLGGEVEWLRGPELRRSAPSGFRGLVRARRRGPGCSVSRPTEFGEEKRWHTLTLSGTICRSAADALSGSDTVARSERHRQLRSSTGQRDPRERSALKLG